MRLSAVYLLYLLVGYVRRMAGFLQRAGGFRLLCAEHERPQSLQDMIWPELNRYIGRFGYGANHHRSTCTEGFICLLVSFCQSLRSILVLWEPRGLQD